MPVKVGGGTGRAARRLTRAGYEPAPKARPKAREELLDTAEALFGLYGINAVSLREIAAAAGQRNSSAVQYHFHDKEGLLDALIQDRIGKVETERRRLLTASGKPLSELTPSELLEIMWRPLIAPNAITGRFQLIRFLLDYHIVVGTLEHPMLIAPAEHSTSVGVMDNLRRIYDHLARDEFGSRMYFYALGFWSTVSSLDHRQQASQGTVNTIEDVLRRSIYLTTEGLRAL
jgi:AcrR family transcriptional regulator